MFSVRALLLLAFLAPVALDTAPVSAQLFGPRAIGRRQDQQSNRQLQGNERFIRGQRAANNFVGSDRAEASSFVGSAQGSNDGQVISSVVGLRDETSTAVNRPRRRRTTGIYDARLSVGFEPRSGEGIRLPKLTGMSRHLDNIASRNGVKVQLNAETRQLTLTGHVSDPHEKRIVELLALFEPGIESVKNEVVVKSSDPAQP